MLRSLAAPRSLPLLLLAAGLLALPAPAAAAGGKEEQAKKALKQALEEDYLNTRFDDAERKLRAALQGCGTVCAAKLRAQLHVALGSVLAGGKKELEDARDEFVEALGLDPKAEPSKDLLSTEVSFAYEQARKKLGLAGGKTAPPPPPKPPPPAETDESPADKPDKPPPEPVKKKPPPPKVEVDEPEERPKPPPPAADPARANWITVSFAPDISYVSGQDVCTQQSQQGSHYACLRADGSRYVGTPTIGNGDQINPGMALGTMRVMLGYDRLVHPNITVGLRAGFAFNGAPSSGASFLPVHGEGRLGFWPGHEPFVGRGVRPMIIISGGVAQVDVKVNVPVVEDGNACAAVPPNSTQSQCTKPSSDGYLEQRQQTLTVYRQNGLGFAAAMVGVQFAPSDRVALHLALRTSVTFPSLAAVLSPEAGLSVGF